MHRIIFKYLLILVLLILLSISNRLGISAESESLQERCRVLLSIEIKNNQVKQSIDILIAEIEQNQELYLKSSLYNDIRKYYEKLQVKLGDYYFQLHKYMAALDCYQKADQYSEQGYREKLAALDQIFENDPIERERRRIHKEINAFISQFLDSKDPTLDDLYRTINGIKSVRGLETITLELDLSNRMALFLFLPPKNGLTIEWLKKYLSTGKNDHDHITKVLEKEFKRQLESELERKMQDGGNSLNDVLAILKIEDLYREYFQRPTHYRDCLMKLKTYFQALQDNNFPALLELYKEEQGILDFCAGVATAWNIENKKKVEERFVVYYEQQAEKILGDIKTTTRTKSNFQQFLRLDEQMPRYLKITFKKDWKIRLISLEKYFMNREQSDSRAEQQVAGFLYHTYPKLAKAYAIAEPKRRWKTVTKISYMQERPDAVEISLPFRCKQPVDKNAGTLTKWYKLLIDSPCALDVSIDTMGTTRDLELQILDDQDKVLADVDRKGSIEKIALRLKRGIYYIKVYVPAYRNNGFTYLLTVESISETGSSMMDPLHLSPGKTIADTVGIKTGALSRWYKIKTETPAILDVQLRAQDLSQDLDLKLYSITGDSLISGTAAGPTEQVSKKVAAGDYYLEIKTVKDESGCDYSLYLNVSPLILKKESLLNFK